MIGVKLVGATSVKFWNTWLIDLPIFCNSWYLKYQNTNFKQMDFFLLTLLIRCFVLFDLCSNWCSLVSMCFAFVVLVSHLCLTFPLATLLICQENRPQIAMNHWPIQGVRSKSAPGHFIWRLLRRGVGDAVVFWLVRWNPDRTVQVVCPSPSQGTMLCSWARHFTLTVFIFLIIWSQSVGA